MKKKKIVIIGLVLAALIGAVFALRDIPYYYISGLEYVRQNYDVTITPIPCDIEIEIDLTRSYPTNTPIQTATEIDGYRVDFFDLGSMGYLFDNHFNISTDVGTVEGKNYKLQFSDFSFGQNPFRFSALSPLDQHKYYMELTTDKTVTGDLAASSVPVDNIQVHVGDKVYKPVWYAMSADSWLQNYLVFRLGLFEDPTVFEELINQGNTTAIVHIDTLYQTDYKLPSVFRMFEKRAVPEKVVSYDSP